MSTAKKTPQDFFEESIGILFLYGQLPVILISFVTIVIIDVTYDTKDIWHLGALYLSAFFALIASLAAVTGFRKAQNTANFFLVVSLVITIIYLSFLVYVRRTEATKRRCRIFPTMWVVTAGNQWARRYCTLKIGMGLFTLNRLGVCPKLQLEISCLH